MIVETLTRKDNHEENAAPSTFFLGSNLLCTASFNGGVLSNGAAFNKKCNLMFVAAGTAEQSRLDAARHARAEFDKVGIKYVAYDSPGTAHEWLTWRRDLNNFAQLLFKN